MGKVDSQSSGSRVVALGRSTAVLLALTLLSAGCASSPRGQAELATPTTNQSETPAPASTPAPSVESGPGTASTESASITGTVLEQETEVETMDSMSVEQFAQLSYADRLSYAVAKEPDLFTGIERDLVREEPAYTTALWNEVSKYAMAAEDPVVGAKLFAVADYYTTDLTTGEISPEYADAVQTITEAGGSVNVTTDFNFDQAGDWQSGSDRLGTPVDFINVTYFFTRRDGSEVTDSTHTAQAIEVTVNTLSGQEVLFYPHGYGIEGVASPDDRYPY